jgi:Clp amino terminal domain, pathogenicity island component
MFERFTEKARRVIFFGRYEAVQFGSPYIETEHLLLGLIREDKRISYNVLSTSGVLSIRKAIEDHSGEQPRTALSVDLPLSNGSKRVLAYAAEEAERLAHRHIGTEHLLLGLIREKGGFAAQLLRDRGLTAEILREHFAADGGMNVISSFAPGLHRTLHPSARGFRGPEFDQAVEIHGAAWNADYIRGRVNACREFNWRWHKQPWTAKDIALDRKTGGVSFDATLVQSSKDLDLVKGGWKKDYCAICRWELWESKEDAEHGMGYTNGRDWLCSECHDKFIQYPNFFSTNYPEIT